MTTPQAPELARATWRTSSHTAQADCVEVAHAGTTYAVRDSKDRADGYLTFGAATWKAFLTDIKNGRHDY